MLIRVRGGEAGIKKYLESGQKSGRDHSRAELDERVILSGNLDFTDAIINCMDNHGERYLHITLSFKEDEISRETLQAITDDFQRFAMAAYDPDEYHLYAEAHLPRLKSYINQQTGVLVERKGHIHVIIPKYNLLSKRGLNPFGKVDQQIKFLEAFQEYINTKYGLSSPKDNRRTAFTDESTMLSRYKGDYFKGANHELKGRILSDVLDHNVANFDQFMAIVARHGETKIRNSGKSSEYLNVKPDGSAKGINLKEYVFSREFIALPTNEKRQRLTADLRREYEDVKTRRPTPDDITRRLYEWHEIRAAEVKYLNSGSKVYRAYREADPKQRRVILADLAERFYAKHRIALVEIELQPECPVPARSNRKPANLPQPENERDGRPTDTVIGQMISDLHESAALNSRRSEFDTIKRELDAARLLATLSHTHGVMTGKYQVTKGQDGSDRIRCGRRNLNVSDFLTHEMHLPWREAAPILLRAYAEQQSGEAPSPARAPRRDLWADYRLTWQPQQRERRQKDWQAQKQHEQERRAELRRSLAAARRRIVALGGTATERRAALSIARMEKVQRDVALREQIERERTDLKARYRLKPADQYRVFLVERAGQGDAAALAELRRQRQLPTADTARSIESAVSSAPAELSAQIIPLTYSVDLSGTVTYYADATMQKAVLVDVGRRVSVEAEDMATIEIGLRLALQKFGPTLTVTGTDSFKRRVIEIAVQSGLRVDFRDPGMSAELQRLRAEAQAEYKQQRAWIDTQKFIDNYEGSQRGENVQKLREHYGNDDSFDNVPEPTPPRRPGPRMG